MSDLTAGAGATAASPTSGVAPRSVVPVEGVSPRPDAHNQTNDQPGGGQTPDTDSPPPSPAVTLAATLANVAEGSRLTGVVIGTDAGGRPLLRTQGATFVVDTKLTIAINSQLTLQVLTTDSATRAALLNVDNHPIVPAPQVGLTLARVTGQPPVPHSSMPGPGPGPTPPQATAEKGHPRLAAGSEVPGTVLREPVVLQRQARGGMGVPLAASSAPSLPPGTKLTIHILDMRSTPPSDRLLSATLPSPLQSVLATAGEATLPGGPKVKADPAVGSDVSSADRFSRLASGVGQGQSGSATESEKSVSAMTTSAAPARPEGEPPPSPNRATGNASPPAPGTPANPMIGIVSGPDQDGLLLVRTPVGLVRLDVPLTAPSGTRLELQVLHSQLPKQMATASLPGEQGAVFALMRQWPALSELVQAVQAGAQAKTSSATTGMIPSPGAALSSGILFFLVALRFGDLTGWLGRENSQALERGGKGALLRRLGDEFAQLGQLSDRASSSDWRAVVFPLFDGRLVHQIRLLTRRRHHGSEDGKDDEMVTRFVVDLDLTLFGALQLDGLVRRRQFDLIVRSTDKLDEEHRRNISAIFYDGVSVSGLAGTIMFRPGPSVSFPSIDEVGAVATTGQGLVV